MEKQFCPHCGQAISAHKHGLSANMIRIMRKAAYADFVMGGGEFHLQQDLNLTKNEYANFQKLKYWGLVFKGSKSGYWRISSHGKGFLANEIRMPKWVRTFNNRVVEQSDRLISVVDCGFTALRYKRREDYARDAVPALAESLF